MDAALTVSSFYRDYFSTLFLDDARPRTFEAYEDSIKHWKQITGDPPMPFGAAILAEFKIELHKSLSPATVNKHLRHINALLAKAGPPGPGNRDGHCVATQGVERDRGGPRVQGGDRCRRRRGPDRAGQAAWTLSALRNNLNNFYLRGEMV